MASCDETPCKVTTTNANRIKTGMDEKEVYDILGDPDKISEHEIPTGVPSGRIFGSSLQCQW